MSKGFSKMLFVLFIVAVVTVLFALVVFLLYYMSHPATSVINAIVGETADITKTPNFIFYMTGVAILCIILLLVARYHGGNTVA